MSREFIFFDYIDNGNNIIKDWLNGSGSPAKARFNVLTGYLEYSSPPGTNNTFWTRPYTWPLHDNWDDYFELRRKAHNVEYRLIGKIIVRNVFLVTWGYHKGSWETNITQQTASERVNRMLTNPGFRREHEYD